jgi:hypothetical protein
MEWIYWPDVCSTNPPECFTFEFAIYVAKRELPQAISPAVWPLLLSKAGGEMARTGLFLRNADAPVSSRETAKNKLYSQSP